MEVTKEMEKWLLVAETNCSIPAREEEFNNWYNNIHTPDILDHPGVPIGKAILLLNQLKNQTAARANNIGVLIFPISNGELLFSKNSEKKKVSGFSPHERLKEKKK